jgi:adenine-specific DNA-methyltransferase
MRFKSRSELQRGRELRAEMTDAEIHLWMRLRRNQMGGHYFRRQVPIGPYIVDFVSVKARLIVEVDGSQHFDAVKRDEQRTARLQARGYRLLRFWNNDVLQRTDSVLQTIRTSLLEAPTLPSPASGGGEKSRA